ncbi:divisome protein SepX/GlpR [Dactylosporangium sp. CS-047395]|uniref:divisome protein SepX/GlpR n=1 Tax=Dactylosporangium sp. CS-047395 TaxID=3239936 RepID=UPI003D92034E
MRVPTSVLLAVLAAAGLLALAPALVRRYDATERLVAERALSTARVLTRADRRRRTVPGRRPVNPPRLLVPRVSSSSGPLPAPRLAPVSAPPARAQRRRVHRAPRAMYRRRRVLLALVLLNLAEVCGITLVSPGFWVSFAVTGALLVYYLAHLRTRALRDRRRRREEARYAAWIARRQAQVRREQLRRAAARREALARQLAERDRARREAARLNSLRGRPYDTRASGQ